MSGKGNGHLTDEETTPVVPLAAKNPSNVQYVDALDRLAAALAAHAERLREVKTSLSQDPNPIHSTTRNEIADVLDKSAEIIQDTARIMRE